jgi:outer membrane protein TolC
VALQAELSEIIAKDGAGTEPQSGVSVMDDTNWSVGIIASLPLFAGGSRFSAYGKAHEEIWRLELTRDAVADRIEQRVASAMHVAGASYAGIKQAREAAEAAQRNLDLVVEAYSRGLVSIIELLDAQNAALVADEIAAEATYDFIIDHLEVQRAMGGYYFELSPDKLEAFFRRWEKFYQEAQDEPLP